MGKSMLSPIGRASFPSLVKPDMYGKHSITVLIPKNAIGITKFVTELGRTVNNEAIAVAGSAGTAQAMSIFSAFKDGDKVEVFKKYRPEYAGHWVLTANKKPEDGKVVCVNRHKQPIDPSEVYAGCNVILSFDIYGYNFNGKKSVTFSAQHVMKVSEGERFGRTAVAPEEAFIDVGELPEEIPIVHAVTGATPPEQAPTPNPAMATPEQAPTNNPFPGV